jgi:hypothetical protein
VGVLESFSFVELFEALYFVEIFGGEASVEVEEVLVFLSPSGQVGFRGNLRVRHRRGRALFHPWFRDGFTPG